MDIGRLERKGKRTSRTGGRNWLNRTGYRRGNLSGGGRRGYLSGGGRCRSWGGRRRSRGRRRRSRGGRRRSWGGSEDEDGRRGLRGGMDNRLLWKGASHELSHQRLLLELSCCRNTLSRSFELEDVRIVSFVYTSDPPCPCCLNCVRVPRREQ